MVDQAHEWAVAQNGRGQFALWPAGRGFPAGWEECSCVGTREVCVNFVERAWTDMRPHAARPSLTDGIEKVGRP